MSKSIHWASELMKVDYKDDCNVPFVATFKVHSNYCLTEERHSWLKKTLANTVLYQQAMKHGWGSGFRLIKILEKEPVWNQAPVCIPDEEPDPNVDVLVNITKEN